MKKSNNKGGLVIGILIGIIIMLVIGVGLFATNTVSFNSNSDNNIKTNEINDEKNNNSTTANMIDITLPSGKTISTNKEFENIFNGKEKLVVRYLNKNDETSDNLEDLIKKEKTNYPDNFDGCKKTKISNDNFDFDNDGTNELLVSFCEEYILLHYYNGKVYGYVLGGYRTNGSWRIDGSSYYSGSAVDNGFLKYTFNNEKLVSSNILSSERDTEQSTTETISVIYKIEEKEVTKEEYEKKYAEQLKIKLIEFVDYSN